ncbi:hypothetical protein BKA70DRAFT_1443499 [Coprinopsis sp. MPI-PUGE-AT-0042]|nr:hypothetical protein BKA70DRAFT_1443499 [Coprinopsis sp. MPI-PUGE-AT-0042]
MSVQPAPSTSPTLKPETIPNDPQEQLPARLYWYDRSKKDWNVVDKTGLLPLTTPPPPRFDDPTSNYWVYGWGVSPAFYKQLLEERSIEH